MKQKEFSLRECYTMACYGLRAVINNGKLEGFTKEDEDGVQTHIPQNLCDMRKTV